MPSYLLRTSLLVCLALAGCSAAGTSGSGTTSGSSTTSGSGTTSGGTTTPTANYNLNGTWKIFATSSFAGGFSIDEFDGTLQATNGSVTGTLTPTAAPPSVACPAANQPVQVTGTLDTDHNLDLTFPIAGGTATIQVTLADNPATGAFGTWWIIGGACPMAAIQMVTEQTAPANPPIASTPTQLTAANFSGIWRINNDYSGPIVSPLGPPPLGITGFDAALQLSNSAVAGSLFLDFYNQPYIQAVYSPIAVTGTLDASNHLTLTTGPNFLGGGTLTVTALLDPNTHTLSDGSYQVDGAGTSSIPSTAMTIAQYAPITGTYTGTLQQPTSLGAPGPSNNAVVTAILSQSTNPVNPTNGPVVYQLSGTVTVTGSCTATFTLPTGSNVAGGKFAAYDPSGTSFVGSNDPDGSTLFQVTFNQNTTGCNSLQGNLTRQ